MTDTELQEIRDRCEKAAPGPWKWEGENGPVYLCNDHDQNGNPEGFILSCEYNFGVDGLWMVYGEYGPDGTWTIGDPSRLPEIVRRNGLERRVGDDRPSLVNADFIAHARADIPKLLAEVERLRMMLANLGVMKLS